MVDAALALAACAIASTAWLVEGGMAQSHLVTRGASPEELQAQITALRGELQTLHLRVRTLEILDRRPWWTRFAIWVTQTARRTYARL